MDLYGWPGEQVRTHKAEDNKYQTPRDSEAYVSAAFG